MERTGCKLTHLLGLPSVHDYLAFMRFKSRGEAQESEATWIAEWEAAAEHRSGLQDKAVKADVTALNPLPDDLHERSMRELEDPILQQALAGLPYQWAAVDIDTLIPHQKVINHSFAGTEHTNRATESDYKVLFDIALGQRGFDAPVELTRLSDSAYSFTSRSMDLRALGVKLLNRSMLTGFTFKGHATHVLCIAVGFGVNCVSAVHYRRKLILFNGTHRVCRWYQQGIKTVPCLVRSVAHDRQLELLGDQELRQSCQVYTQLSRPPRIRDFFDPKLARTVMAPQESRVVHLQFSTQSSRAAVV